MTPTLDQPDTGIICPCDRSWQELRVREAVERGHVRTIFQSLCHNYGPGTGIWARQPLIRDLPEWDWSLPLAHETELQAPEAESWWEMYNQYLAADEWKQKRERCLQRERDLQGRDPPRCQACWRRDATTAHHASYRRLRREPLFDLLAVCPLCHDCLHDSMSSSD
jgi:hypothetical protein